MLSDYFQNQAVSLVGSMDFNRGRIIKLVQLFQNARLLPFPKFSYCLLPVYCANFEVAFVKCALGYLVGVISCHKPNFFYMYIKKIYIHSVLFYSTHDFKLI